MTVRAFYDGMLIAASDDVRVVEGLTYFPIDSVDAERLIESETTTRCFWKGKARYYHVRGGDRIAADAAFTYPRPWPLARHLVADRIAFWRGVEIVNSRSSGH